MPRAAALRRWQACRRRRCVASNPVGRRRRSTPVTEVAEGYTGGCDETAARREMEWMREHYRRKGETPRF